MNTSLKEHSAFWQILADKLTAGQPLVRCLKEYLADADASDLTAAVAELVTDICAGATMSSAMARHEAVFTPTVCLMVRAGEAGGVLEIIASRLAQALEDGSFAVPGVDPSETNGMVRFWRGFGWLISSGVPALAVLRALSGEAASPEIAEAAEKIATAIESGNSLSDSLPSFPELFPKQVVAAVAQAEQQGDLDAAAVRIAEALAKQDLDSLGAVTADGSGEIDAEPVVKLVNLVISDATKAKASDIHLEPEAERLRVRYRIDGVLHEVDAIPKKLQLPVITRLKIISALNIAERRLPQDGRIQLKIGGKPYDLRVSAVPTIHGERITIRILDRDAVALRLDKIGLPESATTMLKELCALPNGLIICSGPTGSGKTTLLYSMLMEVDRDRCSVMSVEDPVEYDLPGVSQIPIRPHIGLTFQAAVRSLLRQDPDVIMIGEIRDLETAQIAVQAAMTGHLVLTTLHAETAPEALVRLLDIGVEPFIIRSTVAGVISQRLVRRLCADCKQESEIDFATLQPAAAEYLIAQGATRCWTPKGCDNCRGTGYRGRTAVHEIIAPNKVVRDALTAPDNAEVIQKIALGAGMTTMLMNGLDLVAAGGTSLDELFRVLPQ